MNMAKPLKIKKKNVLYTYDTYSYIDRYDNPLPATRRPAQHKITLSIFESETWIRKD